MKAAMARHGFAGTARSGVWMRTGFLPGLLLAASCWVQAAPGVSFSHKDWELVCDNTRTCQAAGYQSEPGESEPVSLLLSRAAGPNAPVTMKLQAQSEKAYKGPLQLTVGKLVVRGLTGDTPEIPARDVPKLIQALLRNEEATVTAAGVEWTLSLAGVNAVLLKMDEAQGRLGTPGALVRRGNAPESSVPPAPPKPVLQVAKLPPARTGDAALAKPLLAAVNPSVLADRCSGDPIEPKYAKVYRLTPGKVLLMLPCSMGAYNVSYLLWMANDKPPYQPEFLEDMDGEFSPDEASVHSAMKVRGLGDCWRVKDWHFDGRQFVLTHEAFDSMCRGFAGGAWGHPAHVSTVVMPGSSPAPSVTKKP